MRSRTVNCLSKSLLFADHLDSALEVLRWWMLQEDRPSVLDLPDYVVELLKAEGFFDGEG